jgi:cell wall-associated NlpC family hydrolase
MFGSIALAVTIAGCASTGAVPKPFPSPGARAGQPPTSTESSSRPDAYALVSTALALRGSPYRDGGESPKGFDCSGFAQYVFAQHGVPLPRDVHDQFTVGKSISADKISPGDLLFFSTTERGASHVGIAIGGDQFVHAPSAKGVVRVERLSVKYWSERFIGARRVF